MAKTPKKNPPKAKPNVVPQARNAAVRATGMDAVRKALSYKGADALKPGIEALTAAARTLQKDPNDPGSLIYRQVWNDLPGGKRQEIISAIQGDQSLSGSAGRLEESNLIEQVMTAPNEGGLPSVTLPGNELQRLKVDLAIQRQVIADPYTSAAERTEARTQAQNLQAQIEAESAKYPEQVGGEPNPERVIDPVAPLAETPAPRNPVAQESNRSAIEGNLSDEFGYEVAKQFRPESRSDAERGESPQQAQEKTARAMIAGGKVPVTPPVRSGDSPLTDDGRGKQLKRAESAARDRTGLIRKLQRSIANNELAINTARQPQVADATQYRQQYGQPEFPLFEESANKRLDAAVAEAIPDASSKQVGTIQERLRGSQVSGIPTRILEQSGTERTPEQFLAELRGKLSNTEDLQRRASDPRTQQYLARIRALLQNPTDLRVIDPGVGMGTGSEWGAMQWSTSDATNVRRSLDQAISMSRSGGEVATKSAQAGDLESLSGEAYMGEPATSRSSQTRRVADIDLNRLLPQKQGMTAPLWDSLIEEEGLFGPVTRKPTPSEITTWLLDIAEITDPQAQARYRSQLEPIVAVNVERKRSLPGAGSVLSLDDEGVVRPMTLPAMTSKAPPPPRSRDAGSLREFDPEERQRQLDAIAAAMPDEDAVPAAEPVAETVAPQPAMMNLQTATQPAPAPAPTPAAVAPAAQAVSPAPGNINPELLPYLKQVEEELAGLNDPAPVPATPTELANVPAAATVPAGNPQVDTAPIGQQLAAAGAPTEADLAAVEPTTQVLPTPALAASESAITSGPMSQEDIVSMAGNLPQTPKITVDMRGITAPIDDFGVSMADATTPVPEGNPANMPTTTPNDLTPPGEDFDNGFDLPLVPRTPDAAGGGGGGGDKPKRSLPYRMGNRIGNYGRNNWDDLALRAAGVGLIAGGRAMQQSVPALSQDEIRRRLDEMNKPVNPPSPSLGPTPPAVENGRFQRPEDSLRRLINSRSPRRVGMGNL